MAGSIRSSGACTVAQPRNCQEWPVRNAPVAGIAYFFVVSIAVISLRDDYGRVKKIGNPSLWSYFGR